MDNIWFEKIFPISFCVLAFIINPIFVYLVFSAKSANLGNYRFLLLCFAIFNVIYSVTNVMVPLDIHSYRYCFFVIIRDGPFSPYSVFNTHMLGFRGSLVACSYAVLLSHFVYRYLVIQNSSLTKERFHVFLIVFGTLLIVYYATWHASCVTLSNPGPEIRQYIKTEFQKTYGKDVKDFNMIATLYREGTWPTLLRGWFALVWWMIESLVSIILFFVLVVMIIRNLNKMTTNMSNKTSKFQFELLRALIVQTTIPIVISFSPCLLCWFSPMFGIQLARGFNYLEVTALGLFAFADPLAIIFCIPIFRKRFLCKSAHAEQVSIASHSAHL